MKEICIGKLKIGSGIPKICVPITGRTREEIKAQAAEIKNTKADFVEWRADLYDRVFEMDAVKGVLEMLKKILPNNKPLLFTFRTKGEGGDKEAAPAAYKALADFAVNSGVIQLLDVEIEFDGSLEGGVSETVASIIQRAHNRKVTVITSFHDFHGTPQVQVLMKKFYKMKIGGGDILKIAVMPRTRQDVLTLLEATVTADQDALLSAPIFTMSMGPLGSITRAACEYFGSCATFASVGQSSAPGQMDVADVSSMLELFHQNLCQQGMAQTAKTHTQEGEHKLTEGGMQPGKHIQLIGFMGCGKSSVARKLKYQLGYEILEMDEEIVKMEGMSINEIFSRKGEAYFRNLETGLLKELEGKTPMIVSCGGGVPLREDNVRQMKKNGSIVLLTAKPQTILERVRHDHSRPILKGHKNVGDIKALMEKRREKYEAAADFSVSTDGKSPGKISREIISRLKQKEKQEK